ncbi:MAG TPA: hypothetical protein VNO33_23540, partial [Kofleriaceae bacterium]|nr:hypothetical protein [Kofleriaceae bacterium]
MRPRAHRVLVLALLVGFAACDNANHDNVEKWLATENGVEKLSKALRDSDNDADVRAHAAQNLIIHVENQFAVAREAIDDMSDEE